jgi:undecaprenyl-diphosphatase
MEMLAAVLLGIVQGLTEFLPISSSAHLILVPWFLGWQPEGLVFDVALHVGTAIAVLAYFWRDWVELARESVLGILRGDPFGNPQRKLAWFLVVGTIPAMVIGLAFEDYVEETLRSPLITVVTLVGFGFFLYFADKAGTQERALQRLSLGDSMWVGASQAVALIPGVSRSGITIGTGLLRNLDRPSAARFSFLLSTPVIVGAGVLEGWHFVQALRTPALAAGVAAPEAISWSVLLVGLGTAAITGFFCIAFFLRYIQKNSFLPFVLYRFALAALVLAFYIRS